MSERGVDINEVAKIIENEEYMDIEKVKNQVGHPDQLMFIIMLNGYAHCVPFVIEATGDIFIKTVFPSRYMQRKFGGNKSEADEGD